MRYCQGDPGGTDAAETGLADTSAGGCTVSGPQVRVVRERQA